MRRGRMPTNEPTSDRIDLRGLRQEEVEFYEAVTALLAEMPRGTPVADALASPAGQRIRTKWMLKYGRRPPL